MNLYILCPQWGQEHLSIPDFLHRVKTAGYDGVDMWLPDESAERHKLYDGLQQHELHLVAHQHQANGNTMHDFRQSFRHYLGLCAQAHPLLINSHTGRDYFSFEQNLSLIDLAAEFSAQTGLVVAHETHRGRVGNSPPSIAPYLAARPQMVLTADLSHWVCVSESYLEGFTDVLTETLRRTVHIHARVGHPQGPQVPDPRAPEWAGAFACFMGWWHQIMSHRQINQHPFTTITTEFGPPPYLPTLPYSGNPVANQWEINTWLKKQLRTTLRDETRAHCDEVVV